MQAESGQTLHAGFSLDAGAPAAAPNQAAHPLIKGWVGISVHPASSLALRYTNPLHYGHAPNNTQ